MGHKIFMFRRARLGKRKRGRRGIEAAGEKREVSERDPAAESRPNA